MSGLLHRLAAQAIGVAPAVRPVAGTTWFSPQENREAPRVSAAVASVEPQMERREVAGTQVQPARDAEPIAGQVAPEGVRPAPANATATPSSHAETAAKPAPIATVDDVAPAEPRSGASEPATDKTAPPLPQTPLRMSERATPATPEVRAHPIESRATRDATLQEREALFAPDPPRLFAKRPREDGLPRSALAANGTHDTASPPAVEETTEVHVSIGRIEVTAVHEAPPRKREPARSRKARSLDEYLASRQERRS